MDGYTGQSQFQNAAQLQRQAQRTHRNSNDNMMGMMSPEQMGLGSGSMPAPAQSLDDVVQQNSKDIRRQSMPAGYAVGGDGSMPRSGMMEFHGQSPAGPLDTFHFDPSTDAVLDPSIPSMPRQRSSMGDMRGASHHSNPALSLHTQYSNPQAFSAMMSANGSYNDSPLHPNTALDMNLNSPFVNSGMPRSMDMNMVTNGFSTLDMFANQTFDSPLMGSPMHAQFPNVSAPQGYDPGGGGNSVRQVMDGATGSTGISGQSNGTPDFRANSSVPRTQNSLQSATSGMSNGTAMNSGASKMTAAQQGDEMPTSRYATMNHPQPTPTKGMEMIGGFKLPWTTPVGGWPSTMYGRPHMETEFRDVYAPSGFDLLNIMMRVATRPNPEINIGAVDLSCAFVVCDARQHDNPIKYCSDSFERLTGYSRHEIIGQNCRFLQSPTGEVEPGNKRIYCDDDAVLYLKNCINGRGEAQISLINYRKGGQPFMNLLTMIPLLDMDGETDYIVGFQVDLVERPGAINFKNPDGTYSVNYQRQADMPSYQIQHSNEMTNFLAEFGQTIPRDEVSAVLSQIGSAENEFSKRVVDKILLENCDDVIHVLSLKGLFLYLSPACRRILEYEPSELVGSALSSVCHPSDIVPVTRDLKEGANGSSVSVVFRIRRKRSGYVWFESHGSLHTEQGKGRKCIILVGRERPVYALSKTNMFNSSAGGIGEHEMWTKMSTSGMFLFVSSNVRSLLDRQPEDLVGTNIQSLMRPDSRIEFERVLSLALTGRQAAVKHEMTNRKGQVIQAFTWIHPGDATEGMKPTFLVAQTRLIKYHRGGQRPPMLKTENSAGATSLDGGATPHSMTTTSAIDPSGYKTTHGHAVTHAGQNSLAIGRQDVSLAAEDNVFEELKTTRSTSWQFELRQMEKKNRLLAEEVQSLVSAKKKRKRRRGAGLLQKDCANCHTKHTPEWRRGPSGNRDLCNSCGLRWAKQNGRVSPRTSSQHSVHSAQSDKVSKASASPRSERGSGNPTGLQLQNRVVASSTAPAEKRPVPIDGPTDFSEGHAAKAAKMEVAASQGYDVPQISGGTKDGQAYQTDVGIPEQIDEGVEPDSG